MSNYTQQRLSRVILALLNSPNQSAQRAGLWVVFKTDAQARKAATTAGKQ